MNLPMIILIIGILFFLISIILRTHISHIKQRYSIQKGEIKYVDIHKPGELLFSSKYRLTGKPDYIVRQKDYLIPVEVKTGLHLQPEKNHVMQLAAYCQLVEESYHRFTPYGILVYYDTGRQFTIPFDPKLRFELENTLKEMRRVIKTKKVVRNHDSPERCRRCSMNKYCTQKL
ncbi:MAG: CRISPR-associated protein Cas4 [Thermoplasmata archaeon]|nr:MAG: CRISPR-associated protein Cas4 [Thermoplasmata archaeon]